MEANEQLLVEVSDLSNDLQIKMDDIARLEEELNSQRHMWETQFNDQRRALEAQVWFHPPTM
jgi:hypothetical protein